MSELARQLVVDSSRPLIMGILNLTPDSFSDGGRFNDQQLAVQHALDMMYEGADLIDVGGESTRPGASRVSAEEQSRRIVDVIARIKEAAVDECVISVDTTLAAVAEKAVAAGAAMLNDVSAGGDDEQMFALSADQDIPIVLMHMQGVPETMQINPVYDDVVEDVRAYLLGRAEKAIAVGVRQENIIIDPGIGFGKTQLHNMQLMCRLERFVDSGFPVLLGTSRKGFMRGVCATATSDQLVGATCATTVAGVHAGVRLFRVHDVRANRQAADFTYAMFEQSVVCGSSQA